VKEHKIFRVEITYHAHQSHGETFSLKEERRTWKWALENYLDGPQFSHRRLKVSEEREAKK
jgi:hypothetical protein